MHLLEVVFAKDFAEITDLEVGPDGYLYVVSLGHGAIYKILPAANVVPKTDVVEEDIEEEDIGAIEEEEDEDSDED